MVLVRIRTIRDSVRDRMEIFEHNPDYGTLNLTTGAFTKIAASPFVYAGSLPHGATLFITPVLTMDYPWIFWQVNSAGQYDGPRDGSHFGGAGAEKLMFAPNGTLYGFDVAEGWSWRWGSINPATGAFTQIGNLGTYFPSGIDHNECYGFSLAFGPSGNLYVTGFEFERQPRLRDIEPDNRGLHRNRYLSGRIRRFVGLARPRTLHPCRPRHRCRQPARLRMATKEVGVGKHIVLIQI